MQMQTTPYKSTTHLWLLVSVILLGTSWFSFAIICNYLTAWFLPTSLFPASIPASNLAWLRESLPRLVMGLPLFWLLVPALLGVKRQDYGAFLRASGVRGFKRGGLRMFAAFVTLSIAFSALYLTRYSDALSELPSLTMWWKWLSDIQPPLIEEMLYRGILLSLLVRYTKPWVAITVSSLLFGLPHLVAWGTLSAFAVTTGFGVLLALTWFATGSLWPCVWMHFIMSQGLFLPVGIAYILVLTLAPLVKRSVRVRSAKSIGI